MIIGYGKLQGRPAAAAVDQLRQDLIAAGAETVFVDVASPWANAADGANIEGLNAALDAARPGDVLLSLSPSSLTSSIAALIGIAAQVAKTGATLRVLQLAGGQTLDTGTPAGAVLLTALGLMTAFDPPAERAIAAQVPGHAAGPGYFGMALTQRPLLMGDSFAPRRPRGRPPTATTQATEIARLRASGMRATDIAERLNICRASVYRVLNLASPTAEAPMSDTAAPNTALSDAPSMDRAPQGAYAQLSTVGRGG